MDWKAFLKPNAPKLLVSLVFFLILAPIMLYIPTGGVYCYHSLSTAPVASSPQCETIPFGIESWVLGWYAGWSPDNFSYLPIDLPARLALYAISAALSYLIACLLVQDQPGKIKWRESLKPILAKAALAILLLPIIAILIYPIVSALNPLNLLANILPMFYLQILTLILLLALSFAISYAFVSILALHFQKPSKMKK